MIAKGFKNKWCENSNIDYENLFAELNSLCYPTFKYKQGNCHNLVHYCSLILNNRGIKHKKIWFYAPARLNPNSRECISKPDPNHLALNGNLKWSYHVALFFEAGNIYHIFDLMIDENKPLTMTDWVMHMGLDYYKIDIVDPENYLFYTHSHEGQFQYFKYDGKSKDNKWLTKGMAINETAFEFFSNEKVILEETSELSFDYRTLVGSVLNFECVFKDNSFNKRVSIEFQNNYKYLFDKYKLVYSKNLEKWDERIDILG